MKTGDLVRTCPSSYGDYSEVGLVVEEGNWPETVPVSVRVLWANGSLEHVYVDELELLVNYEEL